MRSFLLSPFKQQAKVASLVSLLLVLAWYALAVLLSIDEWKVATDDFRKWNSGQGKRCERLFSEVETEIAAIDRGRCGPKGEFTAYFQCANAEKARRVELVDAAAKSGCPTFLIGDVPVLDRELPPGSLPVYALGKTRMGLLSLPVFFVWLTFVLLLLGDFSKRVLTEGHSGWKRLSLVASVLSGFAVAGWRIHAGKDGGEALVAGIVSLCFVGAAFIYGRLVFRWVADGFSPEGE